MTDLKQYIIKYLITDKLKVNNWSYNKAWWLRNDLNIQFYNEIFTTTQFLPEDSKFSTRVYSILLGLTSVPECSTCGNPTKWIDKSKSFGLFCSTKCLGKDENNKRRLSKNMYDNQHKLQQGIIDKYGSLSELGKSNYEKKKIKLQEEYGVDNQFQLEQVKDKIKATNMKRYGAEHPSKSAEWQGQKQDKLSELYGVEHHNQIALGDDIIAILNNKALLLELNKVLPLYKISRILGVTDCLVANYFKKHNLPYKSFSSNISKGEKEVVAYIKSLYDGIILENDKKILKRKELDIYLPELKFAIEYNGVYWHSTNDMAELNNTKKRHLYKTEVCESQGIQLFHIFDTEWDDPVKQNIWKSMIKHKLGLSKRIYARNCYVAYPSKEQVKQFLIHNHLQGYTSYSDCIALADKKTDELVSVMTFGKSRFKQDEQELIRFCTKTGYVVIGGFSKLLSKAPNNFVSYANRRWSMGDVYTSCGLQREITTKPNYFYVGLDKRLHNRIKFQKHKLSNLLSLFDSTLTEQENMLNNGYSVLYDCGNIKYTKS